MDRHCDNAEQVVEFLAGHPTVAQVDLPRPRRAPRATTVAARQMKRFGGMVVVPGHRRRAGTRSTSARRAEVFTLGESLGGVESLIEHPGRMTHASASPAPTSRCPPT